MIGSMDRRNRMLSGVWSVGFVLVASCLLWPRAALAWGPDGHRIVAHIAEARLMPQAKAAIAELLGNGNRDADTSLASIANWADLVRRDREETAPWHYVDIPYEMSGFDLERDGKNGNNIVTKLQEFANVLNDRTAPREQRIEALKFVVHFMGDLHQPMHCVERNGDKGGNFRLVFFPGKREAVNLHRIWDGNILRLIMDKQEKQDVTDFAAALNTKITPQQEQSWSGGNPANWANEGHDLAVRVAYNGIPSDGPPPKITDDYLAAAEPAVEMQLSKAGVRLANLLNRIFR
jgi:hypothetical protein